MRIRRMHLEVLVSAMTWYIETQAFNDEALTF